MDDFKTKLPNPGVTGQVQDAEKSGAPHMHDAISFRAIYILRLFWAKRRMVLWITGLGTLLALVIALISKPVFTSTTTLMPPDNTSSSSNLLGMLSASNANAAAVGSALLGVKTPGALFVGILQSRTVQDRLITRFDLVKYYKARMLEDARKRLAGSSGIEENPKNGIITISVQAKTPALAAALAQGYVEELNRVVASNSTSAAHKERVFLEERLDEIKRELDSSAKRLSQFSTSTRTIDLPSQAKETVDIGLKLQTEMATASSELAALRQSYSEDNVRVRSATARIGELQKQMNRISGIYGSTGDASSAGQAGYPSVLELPTLGLTYTDLQRRVVVEEALWEALTKQHEAAKVQEAKDIPTVRILDAANIPERKSGPVRSYTVMVGIVFSLFVSSIMVILTSFWEEMDEADERKKQLREIFSATSNFRRRKINS